jgi:DNA invertase Pin-like site-specific DNA recombinase
VAGESKSVTRQVEHAREYATRKGWTVGEGGVFVDDGRLRRGVRSAPRVRASDCIAEAAAAVRRADHVGGVARLGREAIETAYALKQLLAAGVRVFFNLEDRERVLDSPTDKIPLSLTAFANELEREKSRQRVTDTMGSESEGATSPQV